MSGPDTAVRVIDAHADLSSVTSDQHHPRSHDHSNASDGTSLSPATLTIPSATSPAQTAEGSAVWDSDDDRLTVGTGAGRKTMMNTDTAVQASQLPSTVVLEDQGNTYTTGAQDFGSATSLIVPKAGGAAPTADGDLRYDTTQDAWSAGGAGGINGKIPRVLAVYRPNQTLDAAVITTTETDFTQTFSIPANFFIAQKVLRIMAQFEVTSSAAAPTMRLRMKASGTSVFDNGATGPGNNLVTRGLGVTFLMQGTAAPGASVNVETDPLLPLGSAIWPPSNTIAQPVALATNGALTLAFSIQYSAGTAGNTIRFVTLIIEELN